MVNNRLDDKTKQNRRNRKERIEAADTQAKQDVQQSSDYLCTHILRLLYT